MSGNVGRKSKIGAAVLATAVAVSACSSTSPGSSSDNSSGNQKIKTITFVNPLPNDPQWGEIGKCFESEARKQGLKYTQSGPTGETIDTNYMVDRIQQAVAQHIDGIVTFPLTPTQFDPVFDQAHKAGIEVASIEGNTSPHVDVNVGTSFTQWGQAAAETIAKRAKTHGQQNVVIVTDGPTGSPLTLVDAFKAWTVAHPSAGVHVVDVQYTGGDPTKVPGIVNAMVTAHPDVNMFFTNQAPSTNGLVSTIEQKHLVGKVFVTTNSKYSGSLQGMKSGVVYSTFLQNLCAMGTDSVDALVKKSEGRTVSDNIATPIEFATQQQIAAAIKSGEMG